MHIAFYNVHLFMISSPRFLHDRRQLRFACLGDIRSLVGELVDRMDIVQSGPAVDAECTPVHGLAVFDEL